MTREVVATDLTAAQAALTRGKAESRRAVKERGAERGELADLADLGVVVDRGELQRAKGWRQQPAAPRGRSKPQRRRAKAEPAPAEADPAEIWGALDRLVRVLLPAYLETLGFQGAAERLRVLGPVSDIAATEGLRAVRRQIAHDIFALNIALADDGAKLAASGAVELDVLRARRVVQHPRFERAATMAGLVLDVCGQLAADTGLQPGPWPSPRQCAAIALRQIEYCEHAINTRRKETP